MSGFSPVPGDKFTDEMLAKNFMAIAAGFQDMEKWVDHLGNHVAELYEMAEAAAKVKVKTPSRVKPFLVGAVAGVVLYRYLKQNGTKIQVRVEELRDEAQQRATEAVQTLKDEKPGS